jgi:hypothetical protein
MTPGAVADSEVALRLDELGDIPPEERDVCEDIAELAPNGWDPAPYVNPRLKGGAEYVMPNSGCLQKGHVATSETSCPSVSGSRSASEMRGAFGAGCSCSGGWGSGRLICTKHSEQIGWSQQRVVLRYGG